MDNLDALKLTAVNAKHLTGLYSSKDYIAGANSDPTLWKTETYTATPTNPTANKAAVELLGDVNVAFAGTGTVGGATVVQYLLPGYGIVTKANFASLTSMYDASETDAKIITKWFVDNGYRTDAAAKVHVTDLHNAMVPLTKENIEALQKEYNDIAAKVAKMVLKSGDKYAAYSTTATLDDIEALRAEQKAYADKVCVGHYVKGTGAGDILTLSAVGGLSGEQLKIFKSWDSVAAVEEFLVYQNMHQYDAELKAIDLTDKDAVVALYDKYYDLKLAYDYITVDPFTSLSANADFEKFVTAYNNFEKADLAALTNAGYYEEASENGDKTYYFDASEDNVKALEATRAAYDTLVKYYADYDDATEAKLLAAEHNKAAAAGFDAKDEKIDNSIVKTYLNNATVTVKSTKLAAKKVRVQAKVDTTTLKLIVEQLGAGATVEYKFYHKAPGKSFKFTKTKNVNYITYTSKSLKAGKNSFRVGLVVKDKDGKVVATKDYQASTLAYRTIK